MKVLKTFVRNGTKFKPGDAVPQGLEKVDLAHYQQLGMIGEPAKADPKAEAKAKAKADAEAKAKADAESAAQAEKDQTQG